MTTISEFRKILVANRGEIATRIFRACTELNKRTVAIYSDEDSLSLHRYKADESYLVGEGKGPIEAYLDIEGIIEIAVRNQVDAIHPGYGFLAENETFARRCEEAGIAFIGPRPAQLRMFGDKMEARKTAIEANVPVVPGTQEPIEELQDAMKFAKEHGYPVIIKAASGGGGRGMRIVREQDELKEAFNRARSEAQKAFGNSQVYIEKYIDNPKHIEVQIIADRHGNTVHLFERDCSIQRRHQKIVEVAPGVSLSGELREAICQSAIRLMKHADYINAGTVEYLVTPDGQFYFIEVNPRIQVEHTITELVTDIDIVHSQIRIAEGYKLTDPEVAIGEQEDIRLRGFAIQCRITTEDPMNGFLPDSGKISVYRDGGGYGIRLDSSNAYAGATITPHYDSLLVKICSSATTFGKAAAKMRRALQEFRIRGVKTNIPFLENVIDHPRFLDGNYTTAFIDTATELFEFPERRDRATKLLTFIGNTVVNGYPGLPKKEKKPHAPKPRLPKLPFDKPFADGTKQLLDRLGPEGLAAWILEQPRVLLTDTTFRDAHQSLLATRVRTYDLLQVAETTAKLAPGLFSLEMWGGATFDTSMRFLKESPWDRLRQLREKVPNVLFQMLLRGANAVGYSNYPDNVTDRFVRASASAGIDVFRIFDSLNWVEGMKGAIDSVRSCGKIAEAAICYTGDILDPQKTKYSLDYYVKLALELEAAGAHVLGIKDMAGLLKPYAAYELVKALKAELRIPVHLHTHDTSGNGVAILLKAAEAGVDIVDAAIGSMSGSTSQPSLNAFAAAMAYDERSPELDRDGLESLGRYWEDVRGYYHGFESQLKGSHTDVYHHEMPGGQYSNLQQQAQGVGLGERWQEVVDMYAVVNRMFGDIVKVTPSSKVVGDMALFMVQNHLDEQAVYEQGETLHFPDSVVQLFQGYLGQPYQGFPERLQRIVLKDRERITCRPGDLLPPVDWAKLGAELEEKLGRKLGTEDLLSYVMYPQVYLDFDAHLKEYSEVAVMDTPTFFYGLRQGETTTIEIEKGKTLIVKLLSIGPVQSDGTRIVYFELNGTPREVAIADREANVAVKKRAKVQPGNANQVGATMPGKVLKIMVEEGDTVKKGEHLFVTEAMKMETTVQAPKDARIKRIHVKEGDAIEVKDLLLELE
ncbi:MAG: pyruvate carboxylase [Paenibacillaceae bacterium]|nr:pyruvate carboxylase [Paenibacillaceae bacterium]